MKKYLLTLLVLLTLITSSRAQTTGSKAATAPAECSSWTLNTRAWCTNYFTTAIFALLSEGVTRYAFAESESDSMWAQRIFPSADLVFPIGMSKRGFGDADIYGPYHYAFGNPFKHIGDYAIGADASFHSGFIGLYVGTYFKSQEVVLKGSKDNIRGFYVQPRAGIILGSRKRALEVGAFYDALTGCGGSLANTERKMLKGGFGLDFSFSRTDDNNKSKTLLSFSMPLHNFFNTDYPDQQALKRKVGYIILTQRICL